MQTAPDVNVDAVNELIDAISQGQIFGLRIRFNMGKWLTHSPALEEDEPHCGTAGCLAGFGAMLWADGPRNAIAKARRFAQHKSFFGSMAYGVDSDSHQIWGPSAKALNLGRLQAQELFQPCDIELEKVQPETAIRCLQILRAERVIDWARAIQETGCEEDHPDLFWKPADAC